MIRCLRVCLLLTFATVAARAVEPAPALTGWDRISVGTMKTSIYIGSVTLATGVFQRQGSSLSTTYDAKVRPWFFWGESGSITITLSDADLVKLAKGEKAEFAGTAANQRKKARTITGYAQPVDAISGKIKVRILADGIELVFNGTYHFGGG